MVQVFFVMLFFPVVMNALQYYIIDSFIKNQKPNDHELIPSEDEDDADQDDRGRRRSTDRAPDSESDNEAEIAKETGTNKVSKLGDVEQDLKKEPKNLDEYDPDTDGSRSVGSSRSERDKLPPPLQKDLRTSANGN